MINIRGNESNKYVILALTSLGVNASKIILKRHDNNVKCFLFYIKKYNGKNVEKVIQIESKNYLRLLSYGIRLSSKGEDKNELYLSRKNS